MNWIKKEDYSAIMAENGRKGGLAKGAAYHKRIKKIIHAFVNTRLSQQEIADELGVSQAMVNKYVNNDFLKKMRLENNSIEKIFTDEEINTILQKIKLEKELKKEAKILKPVKKLKI